MHHLRRNGFLALVAIALCACGSVAAQELSTTVQPSATSTATSAATPTPTSTPLATPSGATVVSLTGIPTSALTEHGIEFIQLPGDSTYTPPITDAQITPIADRAIMDMSRGTQASCTDLFLGEEQPTTNAPTSDLPEVSDSDLQWVCANYSATGYPWPAQPQGASSSPEPLHYYFFFFDPNTGQEDNFFGWIA